jgi:sialate O-acetylesterase
MQALLAITAVVALSGFTAAELTVSNVFGSHMVLQRDRPVPVWGWSAPSTPVTVTLGSDSTVHVVADAKSGLWKAMLPPQQANAVGQVISIKATGQVTITLDDVLFGDVVMCSGQSKCVFDFKQLGNVWGGSPAGVVVMPGNRTCVPKERSLTRTRYVA